MKRILTACIIFLLFTSQLFAQFSDVFSGYITNNVWSSNGQSQWEIVPSSTVAGGASNSKTLKLNATTNSSINYLSIQHTSEWGTEQTWSFWMGRDKYKATTDNLSYVWLYADGADFTNNLIEGYRIRLGGNTVDGEDIILEYVNGNNVVPIINDNNVIPVNQNSYGLTVVVTRSSNSKWTIYTSVSPIGDNGGVNANSDPLIASTINRNPNGEPKFENSITDFSGGYFGFMARQSSTTNQDAKKAAEFDQFSFKSSIDHTDYTWIGSTGGIYGAPTNWNPNRIVRRNTDVLIFNSESTITGVESDIVSRLLFRDNSNTTFKATSEATITITGTDEPGLLIEEGSALHVLSDNPLTISLSVGVKGEIRGEFSFSKNTGNVVHKLLVTDLEALSVFGTFIQNCNGNVFGNSTIEPNRVAFKAGSEFILKDGANPFGNNQAPRAKFETGSWYRHQANTAFATTGVYANFELNLASPTSNVTIIPPQTFPMTVDNLLLTQGGLILSNDIGEITIEVRESLNVAPNGRLEMNLDNKGTSVVNLLGTLPLKSIQCTGEIKLGNTSFLKISNDYSLEGNLRLGGAGTLTLNNGILNLEAFELTLPDQFTIQKVQGTMSKAALPNPNLRYRYGDGLTEGIISIGNELQDAISDLVIDNPEGVNLFRPLALSDSLILNTGKLFSSQNVYITMGVGSKVSGSSDLSFVSGPIAKETNTTSEFLFPIGQGNFLRPLGIIPSSTEPSTFICYYNDTPPVQNEPETIETPLKSISETESWNLERVEGTADFKVKLFWNERSGIVWGSETFDLKVARFNGTNWEDKGAEDHTEGNQNNGFLISGNMSDFTNTVTFGSVSENTTFPVTLLSFNGMYENNQIKLYWETALENNNKGFEVQKSLNGVDFTSTEFIPASTSTALRKTYTFSDFEAQTSTFYRLKQIDYNGTFQYSKIILVKVTDEQGVIDQINPNPFKDQFELELVNSNQLSIKAEIKNTQGIKLSSFAGSLREVNIKLNNSMRGYISGMYYFTITSNGSVKTIKVLKE